MKTTTYLGGLAGIVIATIVVAAIPTISLGSAVVIEIGGAIAGAAAFAIMRSASK